MSGLWPIPCSNNIQGGCMPGPLLMATPESDRLHVNCAKMETGLINCRTYPGADCDTDHQLLRLMATLKVRLAKRQHSIPPLNLEEKKAVQFAAEVTNRFTALEAAQNEVTPEDLCKGTKTVLLEVARETTESVKSQKKKKMDI